jgi:hypothetical protein
MSTLSQLITYQAVNKTTSTKELATLVQNIAKQGELKDYDTEAMVSAIKTYKDRPDYFAQLITRKFGIRQQTMMLNFYNK